MQYSTAIIIHGILNTFGRAVADATPTPASSGLSPKVTPSPFEISCEGNALGIPYDANSANEYGKAFFALHGERNLIRSSSSPALLIESYFLEKDEEGNEVQYTFKLLSSSSCSVVGSLSENLQEYEELDWALSTPFEALLITILSTCKNNAAGGGFRFGPGQCAEMSWFAQRIDLP